jgi:CBS domain-containing protein
MNWTSALKKPWDRPIEEFPGLVHLAPPVNHPDDPLTAVIEAFSKDRGAGAIFVVDSEDRPVGCIRERTLDMDLITLTLPEQLWPSIREMDARDFLRATHARTRTAGELMVPVKTVAASTPLKDAVAHMARGGQPAIGLVDAEGRLLGYISLFEALAHLLRS